MPIPAGSDSHPGVSLINPDDAFKWALIDINPYDVRKFGTEELTGKQGYVLTVYTIDPGAAVKGNQTDGYEPITEGEVVNIYVSGYAKWDPDRDKTTTPYGSWGAATKPFGRVGTEQTAQEWVGLIGEWKYLEQLPPSQPGISGRKDRKFRLRKATPEEAHIVQRCHDIGAAPVAPADTSDNSGPFDATEDVF